MALFATPITYKVLIRTERVKVFDSLTTAEGLDRWFTNGAYVDRRPGGKSSFKWIDWGPDNVNTQAVCPIVEVKVPERFVYKWWEDHYTTGEIDFAEV